MVSKFNSFHLAFQQGVEDYIGLDEFSKTGSFTPPLAISYWRTKHQKYKSSVGEFILERRVFDKNLRSLLVSENELIVISQIF